MNKTSIDLLSKNQWEQLIEPCEPVTMTYAVSNNSELLLSPSITHHWTDYIWKTDKLLSKGTETIRYDLISCRLEIEKRGTCFFAHQCRRCPWLTPHVWVKNTDIISSFAPNFRKTFSPNSLRPFEVQFVL